VFGTGEGQEGLEGGLFNDLINLKNKEVLISP
jgi:hypothetical protein